MGPREVTVISILQQLKNIKKREMFQLWPYIKLKRGRNVGCSEMRECIEYHAWKVGIYHVLYCKTVIQFCTAVLPM
jgi:hypothetical protein